MKTVRFIKTPKNGKKIKIYMPKDEQPKYGIVKGIEKCRMIEDKSGEAYFPEMCLVYVVQDRFKLPELDFYYMKNRVVFINDLD